MISRIEFSILNQFWLGNVRLLIQVIYLGEDVNRYSFCTL